MVYLLAQRSRVRPSAEWVGVPSTLPDNIGLRERKPMVQFDGIVTGVTGLPSRTGRGGGYPGEDGEVGEVGEPGELGDEGRSGLSGFGADGPEGRELGMVESSP